MRELRKSICLNNCLNILQWARPELQCDREIVLKDKILPVADNEHQMPNIQGYMSANKMRDALIDCLYFCGGSKTFLLTIERLYEYMHKSVNRNINIKNVYALAGMSKLTKLTIQNLLHILLHRLSVGRRYDI